jgi:hypothetical protein
MNMTSNLKSLESCDVSELNRRMTNMPRQMREFSLGLRSLFAENAVSGVQGAEDFRRYVSGRERERERERNLRLDALRTFVSSNLVYFAIKLYRTLFTRRRYR